VASVVYDSTVTAYGHGETVRTGGAWLYANSTWVSVAQTANSNIILDNLVLVTIMVLSLFSPC
jgi:hypothetical protein